MIIKWKSDTLYLESVSDGEIEFTMIDELEKTKKDFIAYYKKEDTPKTSELEVIEQSYITVRIPQDASIDEIADELLKKKLMTDREAFKLMVYNMGLDNKFAPGSYEIAGGTKILDTVLKLTGEKQEVHTITIVDGDDGYSVATKLKEMGVIESVDTLINKIGEMKLYYSFKPGEYEFTTPIRNSKLIELLTK